MSKSKTKILEAEVGGAVIAAEVTGTVWASEADIDQQISEAKAKAVRILSDISGIHAPRVSSSAQEFVEHLIQAAVLELTKVKSKAN